MTPEELKEAEEYTKQRMRDICDRVKERLPEGYGFIVMVAPFSDNLPMGHEGRLNYASNIQRKQAINMLKEWLIKASAAEDWMKHLE